MKGNIIKQGIESIIGELLGDVYIESVGEEGEKMNQIYLVHSDVKSVVLKLIGTANPLQGEESLFDIIYDAKVHEYVCRIAGAFCPPRRVIAYDNGSSNPFNSPYVVQEYINGEFVVDEDLSDMRSVNKMISSILKMYASMSSKTEFSKVTVEDLRTAGIDVEPDYIEYVDNRVKSQSLQSDKNFVRRYIKNDILAFAPEDYKGRLLDFIDSKCDYLNINEYHLVHGDFKLGNIIKQNNNYILIDWSRAYFGDIAHDLAYLLVAVFSASDVAHTVNVYDQLKKLRFLSMENVRRNLDDRIIFYMFVLFFSMGRVFYPNDIAQICEGILSPAATVYDFLENNKWVMGRKY